MKCVKYAYYAVFINVKFDPRVDEALKQEFMDELLVMSKLKHPNVVSLIGACLEPPNLCMVMELCDYSLHHLLHGTNTYLSPQQLTRMAGDIANGMRFLHSRKPAVIHRDLKSANVLLDPKGVAKLCDFGLVRTKFTSAGTPCYMPPELLSGHPFSKSVDVYMFGILLWEIFSRDIPFRGYDISDIKRRVLAGERFRVPTVDCPRECQNGSGDIDIDELRDIAEDLGEPLSEIELQYLAKEFDTDESGAISWTEFITWWKLPF
ncbi:TKL protein kinase [Phytophthora palmivora]|uniref:TKL protein kinase n=1 Tax=Phytophthora palmivora TaxID=4796 RepID=A0A2P4X7T2_9STRA|nr:TKL protein kinase [Phytophthora palmivora]